MSNMKPLSSFVLLGDVVGSRRATDRLGLHRRLEQVLEQGNQVFGTDLRITVGDEYQGHCDSLGTALALTWWLRVQLLPEIDVRHGIGVGETHALTGIVEDGPGWWAARAAIEAVGADAERPRSRTRRDRVVLDEHSASVAPAVLVAVDAALAGRDELTARLDARDLSVVRGLLDERTQSDLAESLGISASAVSQRIRHQGIGVLVEMGAGLARL